MPYVEDMVQVGEFRTGVEQISYEGVGFAERIGGHKLVETDVTTIGGELRVNPIGGRTAPSVVTASERPANGAG